MAYSIIYLPLCTLIAEVAYRLMLSIVVLLSNEDKKSSCRDMGEATYLRRRVSCSFQPRMLHEVPAIP
jgi:hypothetical protein